MIRRRDNIAFSSSLCLFVGILFLTTLDLAPTSRLIPLRVVVPTLALILFQLLLDAFPTLAHAYEQREKTEVFTLKRLGLGSDPPAPDQPPGIPHRRMWSAFSCGLSLLVLVYFLGFPAGTPIFTALYLRVRARETWRRSLILTAAVWILVYGVFATALGARLHDGRLWTWL